MTISLKWIDPRSLLIVLTAFIGNAEIMGMTIGLFTVIASAFFLTSRPHFPPQATVLSCLALTFLLLVAAARSPEIGITYTDSYWLWPLQTIALYVMIVVGGPLRWPTGNVLAFATLGLVIFALGSMVDGRLYSLFGPNMLYRIFGFLYIFALILYFDQKGAGRLTLLAVSGFGLFATLLTGSVGGIFIIAIGVWVFILRLSKAFAWTLAIGSGVGIWLFLGQQMAASLAFNPGMPNLLRRLLYKAETWDTSHRFEGWMNIILEGPTLVGHRYSEFAHMWFTGFLYPHNLFVELYGFFGLVGAAIGCFVIAGGVKSFIRAPRGDIVSLAFLVLALGAMFSGDLTDNYGVIAFAAAMLFCPKPSPLASKKNSVLRETVPQ